MAQKKATTTKKAAPKKPAAKKAAPAPVAKATEAKTNFMTFKVTEQTIYWAIIGAMVLALGIWVMTINARVQAIYDQIDALTTEEESINIKAETKE